MFPALVKRLRPQSLSVKIGLSYLALTALTVAIGAFAALRFADLGAAVERILSEEYQGVLAAENMVKALERQEAALLRMRVATLSEGRQEFLAQHDQFLGWYREAVAGADGPREAALLNGIGKAYEAYLAAADTLYVQARSGLPGAPEGAAVAADGVRSRAFQLLEANQDAMLAERTRVEGAAETGTRAVAIAAVCAALASALAGLRFARTITDPLRRLTGTVGRLGRGHFDERVEAATDDEVGALGRAFNALAERLAAYEALNVQALMAEKGRAEAERQKADVERQKAESLVEAMPSPVVVTDDAGRLVLLNRAALGLLAGLDERAAPLSIGDGFAGDGLGGGLPVPVAGRGVVGLSGWAGRPLAEVAPVLAARLAGPERPAPDAPPGLSPPEAVLDLDVEGRTRYFRPRRTNVSGPDGGVALRVTLLEDVTPFKALDQAKSDFLAAVSHELRTPLTSLGVALDLLLGELVGALAPPQRELVETAKGDQERLKKLVAGLIRLARLEAGADPLRRERLDLDAVVSGTLDGLRLPARQEGVALEVERAARLPRVLGDAETIGWVLTNLVGNALRHTPPGGRVTVRLRPDEGGGVRVEVEDSGAGLEAEAVEHVFEPFVQLDGPASRPGSAGLGLSIARRVVEAHGGRIGAEARPGQGGFFFFTLPAADGAGRQV